MILKEANLNSVVRVININARGELRIRFFDLGIIEGTDIKVLYGGPFGDPKAYLIRGTVIAIREEECEEIEVI